MPSGSQFRMDRSRSMSVILADIHVQGDRSQGATILIDLAP
ncbi:unnamed protein product [Tuwongella immobilis]|uniref:Uncharacterized protein n=1 Tax=Tuwongella immobilis TaxID=692036 RepID=A0A6C2YJK8_9BACT|nr:unnamed protein product [Tuwongella immobilis]VTR98016.1 unnamed protein product [Tuwongella immobilis]